MKRRTFLLGLGTLTVLSGGFASTNATIQQSVSFGSDSRVIESVGRYDAWLNADPNTKNDESVHTWYFENVPFDGEVARIHFEYPDPSFGKVRDDTVTVELTRAGESIPRAIPSTIDRQGSEATVYLDHHNHPTDIDGPVVITIDGILNPRVGTHHPEITFVGISDTLSTELPLRIVERG